MAAEGTAAMTVLIVDDDLGFVWWLGDIFNEAGARCVPALSCGAAMVLAKRLGVEPDMVILNASLDGASKLLEKCTHTNPHLKIVTIGVPSKALSVSIQLHAIVERPSPSEPIFRREWSEKLRKLLIHVEAAIAG
jgi:DNA-binding NtrC family response regulator